MGKTVEPIGLLLNLQRLQAKYSKCRGFGGLTYEQLKDFIVEYDYQFVNKFGYHHPTLTDQQFEDAISKISILEEEDGWETNLLDWWGWDILLEKYRRVLKIHFNTRYRSDCNLSLIHFFSGRIRLYRFRDLEKLEAKQSPSELEYMRSWLEDTELNEKILRGEISDV